MENANNIQSSSAWGQIGQAINSIGKHVATLGSNIVKLQRAINSNPLQATVKNIVLLHVLQYTNGGAIPSLLLAAEMPSMVECLPELFRQIKLIPMNTGLLVAKTVANQLSNKQLAVVIHYISHEPEAVSDILPSAIKFILYGDKFSNFGLDVIEKYRLLAEKLRDNKDISTFGNACDILSFRIAVHFLAKNGAIEFLSTFDNGQLANISYLPQYLDKSYPASVDKELFGVESIAVVDSLQLLAHFFEEMPSSWKEFTTDPSLLMQLNNYIKNGGEEIIGQLIYAIPLLIRNYNRHEIGESLEISAEAIKSILQIIQSFCSEVEVDNNNFKIIKSFLAKEGVVETLIQVIPYLIEGFNGFVPRQPELLKKSIQLLGQLYTEISVYRPQFKEDAKIFTNKEIVAYLVKKDYLLVRRAFIDSIFGKKESTSRMMMVTKVPFKYPSFTLRNLKAKMWPSSREKLQAKIDSINDGVEKIQT